METQSVSEVPDVLQAIRAGARASAAASGKKSWRDKEPVAPTAPVADEPREAHGRSNAGDWNNNSNFGRRPRPVLAPGGPVPPSTAPKSTGPNREYGKVQDALFWKRGKLISLVHHTPWFNFQVAPTHPAVSLSRQNTWVHSKARKFVVIEVFLSHYVALPVYTYDGKGIRARSEQERNDYIGVRDSAETGNFQSDTDNGYVIATRAKEFRNVDEGNFHFISRQAYCNAAEPHSFSFRSACKHEGEILGADDIEKVVKLYYARAPKPPGAKRRRKNVEEID